MLKRGIFLVLLAGSLLAPLLAIDTGWITSLGGKIERDAAGRIVAVNLRGSWINDVEMIELARLPDLERLDLSHTRISDEGMLNLKPAPKIKELKLFYSEWITDQGLTAIKEWKHLKRLDLRGTRISDGTMELVSLLTGLEALDIAQTEVTDVGLENLITLVNLKELAVGRGRLSNAGLVKLRMLPTLTYLDMSGARPTPPDAPGGRGAGSVIPEETLKAIAELKDLRTLYLGFSTITADGLRTLSGLDKVEKLGLQGCTRVNDAALTELAKWKGLKYLDLQEDPVTEAGLAELRKARPGIKILSGGTPPPPPLPYSR
jgi:Leucine-rich repeat (LRR) protein